MLQLVRKLKAYFSHYLETFHKSSCQAFLSLLLIFINLPILLQTCYLSIILKRYLQSLFCPGSVAKFHRLIHPIACIQRSERRLDSKDENAAITHSAFSSNSTTNLKSKQSLHMITLMRVQKRYNTSTLSNQALRICLRICREQPSFSNTLKHHPDFVVHDD